MGDWKRLYLKIKYLLKLKYRFYSFLINFGLHSITIPSFGATEVLTTFQEVRLALTYKRQIYRRTGPYTSPRSVSVRRSTINSDSLSLTRRLTHFTPLSLMGNTAPPQLVVMRGSCWLAHRPPCSRTAIRKDSMLWETLINPKQESESPLTRRMTVLPVTPELVLAQEVYMMTPTRVEMRQRSGQIMATGISKPWGTSWYYDRGHS